MAQLRDSLIDGNLEVTGNIILKTNDVAIHSVHPNTGVSSEMLRMSSNGDTIIGGGGYENHNGNTNIHGEDVVNYIGSADVNFRPYYRAGDSIGLAVRTSGYVTSSGQNVIFTVPLTKPIIGAPNARVTKSSGFVLRQNGYTHGSDPSVAAIPTSIQIDSNFNSGFIVTAAFDNTTNVENNSPIGIYWNATIELS